MATKGTAAAGAAANEGDGAATGDSTGQDPKGATGTPKGQEPAGKQSTDLKPPANDPGDGSDLGFTEKQQAYVGKLRKEAGSHRTRSNELDTQVMNLNKRFDDLQGGLKKLFGGDDANLTPEQRVEQLTAHNEELELQSAISEAAVESGIGKEHYEFFDFLLRKEVNALEEGQELSDDQMSAIVAKAKVTSGASGTGKNTSVTGGKDGNPPPEGSGDAGEVSLDQFVKMSISEQSELYQKNKPLYDTLHKQAREEGKLV